MRSSILAGSTIPARQEGNKQQLLPAWTLRVSFLPAWSASQIRVSFATVFVTKRMYYTDHSGHFSSIKFIILNEQANL